MARIGRQRSSGFSPSLPAEADAASQRIRATRRGSGPLCVRASQVPGVALLMDGEGGSGYADFPVGFLPLTCPFSQPDHCRRLPRRQARAGRRRIEGVGDMQRVAHVPAGVSGLPLTLAKAGFRRGRARRAAALPEPRAAASRSWRMASSRPPETRSAHTGPCLPLAPPIHPRQ